MEILCFHPYTHYAHTDLGREGGNVVAKSYSYIHRHGYGYNSIYVIDVTYFLLIHPFQE